MQQDQRRRPAIEHNVVIRQHKPMLIWRGADQRRPKRRPVSQVTDRGTLSGAPPHDLLLAIDAVVGQFDIPARTRRIDLDDLHRLVELPAEAGRQIGMAIDHGVRASRRPMIKPAGFQRDIQLHRIHIVAAAVRDAGVKQQSLLQGGEWQHVNDLVSLLELVDLLLAQLGRRDIRRRRAATAPHMRADTGQRLKPRPAERADLRLI